MGTKETGLELIFSLVYSGVFYSAGYAVTRIADHGIDMAFFGKDIDLIMATFSKSFASLGGFIATDSITANFIRHTARSYIFSASATPAAIGAVNAALDIMESEPERIKHLWDITNFAIEGFRNMGCEIGNTSTPIIPLYIRDNVKTFQVTRDLFDEGLFVNPVVSPAVPSEDTLIRFSLMATHTKAQVEYALETIQKVFKKYDIIK